MPGFTVNLLVRDVEAALPFYRDVLGAQVHYADEDFAAVRVDNLELMLHADHTYDGHPWYADLSAGKQRGLGAELRLMGFDADAVEAAASTSGATIVRPATTKGHGWREVMIQDSDGYVWAVGNILPEA
jgi:uncharacterized glyoxalase superfamily protein PhnB